MKPLNIALVHAYSWPEVRRGGERLVDDLTTYLRGAGHRVDVFSGTKGESTFHPGPQGRNYRLHVPSLRALERRGVGRIETFGIRALVPLLLHSYDVVHAFTPTAALAAMAAGQSTVYTVIGHPTVEKLPDHRLQRTALTRAIAMSTEVAVLSRSAARALEPMGRNPVVLAPGVALSRFAANLEPRSGPPRLLFSGDLGNPDKGLPTVLSAFDPILARHPEARLMLSGPGRPDRAVREVGAAWSRIEASVDLLGTGAVDDVPERYRSAHVTILPSRDEAFGIVHVESLASGTPTIGGKPGGAEDIIDTDVGRLVGFGDVDGLVAAIDDCIGMAGEAASPERCRARSLAWDWSAIGPQYEAVYASIAGRRRLPGAALWRASRVKRAAPGVQSGARPSRG